MEALKRSVDRRAKGYERVEVADPDSPTAWANINGFPVPTLQQQQQLVYDYGSSDSSEVVDDPSPKVHDPPVADAGGDSAGAWRFARSAWRSAMRFSRSSWRESA